MTAFLLLWLLTQAISAILVFVFAIGLGAPVRPKSTPRAAVLVAVKGYHEEFDHFVAHLFGQDYPFFRVIFAVEAESDTAIGPIEKLRARMPDRVDYVVAGQAQDEGQKVANLRAALTRLKPADEVVVFADSDIRPLRDWLQRLVAPLVDGRADVVSGFAWLVVKDRNLSTFVMAIMSSMLVTMPRLPYLNAAWGGSTAMLRDRCDALKLNEAWRGALCDDLHLTAVAQRAGYTIVAPREVLPRLYVTTNGIGDVAPDAVRWLMCFRMYMPLAYYASLFGLTFVVCGWLAAAFGAVSGGRTALAILLVALVLAVIRAAGRALIVARLWGRAGWKENRMCLLLDPLLSPCAALCNALFAWWALFTRRTHWAGTTYEMLGPNRTRVLSRRTSK